MASLVGNRRRLLWVALAAVVIVLALPVSALLLRRFPGLFTRQTALRATIAALVLLEVLYVLVLLAAGAGAAAIGLVFYRRGLTRSRNRSLIRAFVLCIGCLAAAALSEVVATGWLAWSRKVPPLTRGVSSASLTEDQERSKDDEVTITVLGESSATGVPFDSWLSVGKIVAWQLGKRLPTKKFYLDLVAKSGDTLERQHRKLAAIKRRPDILIVYCGHNEFDSVIPWSHRVEHYVDEARPLHLMAYQLAGRVSSMCALIRTAADMCRVVVLPPSDSHPPLVDVPAFTPVEFTERLDDFRRRLVAIAEYGERINAHTVLVIPPGNDGGFDPNRSYLEANTPRGEREKYEQDFLRARQVEDSDQDQAILAYRALCARQPGFAETHYRLGLLLARSGDWDEAYQRFVSARDLDGYPLRCVSAFQDVYREVAKRHRCILIDSQCLFRAIGYHGLLDDHTFQDAMHPSLQGHVALAQSILDALHEREAFGWTKGSPGAKLRVADCAAHFGFEPKDWKTLCERGAMFYYATIPMRSDRTERVAKFKAFEAGARRLAGGASPESIGLPNIGITANARLRPDASGGPPSVTPDGRSPKG